MTGPGQIWELGQGAWCRLEPLLSAEQSASVLGQLLTELDWESRAVVLFGRQVLQPRQVAWAGELPYRYSGQTLPPRAGPPCLLALCERIRCHTGVRFNHVLCNRYRDGSDHMGFHSDSEPELGPNPTVCCLSLGAERDFVFRSRTRGHSPHSERSRHTLRLPAGSLFTMGGTFQHKYLHALPPRRRVHEERVSLTFRKLLRLPQSRGSASDAKAEGVDG